MSKKSAIVPPSSQPDEKVDRWFADFIDTLRVDHLLLTTQTASPEKQLVYNALISGDDSENHQLARQFSSRYFAKNVIFSYLDELKKYQKFPLQLAFGLSDSKILVWAKINDDDESAEDALLLAEAKINGQYQKQGFYINSTIIEESDNLSVPPHYILAL